MIEQVAGRPDGMLEFRITGKLTARDYDTVLNPVIERALEEYDRLKLLIVVDESYEGFDLGAAWEDAQLGLKHWSGFSRVALVTNKDWLTAMAKAMAFMMPCPVKVFELDELDEARRWLGTSLGAIHMRELGRTALHVELLGKLEPAAYAEAEGDLDAFINRAGGLRLLLDLREFDGWQGLTALRDHLSLVRDHFDIPDRVAVVMDDDWVKIARGVLGRFLKAEVKVYPEERFDDAKSWITQADA